MTGQKVFIATAITTTGPNLGEHSIIQLGVCVVGNPVQHLGLNFDPLTKAILDTPRFTGPRAADQLRNLHITDPRRQTLRLAEWIKGVCRGKDFKPILVSDSPETWQFVQWYMQFALGDSPFGSDGMQDVAALLKDMRRMHGPLSRAYELAALLQVHLPYPA